MEAIRAIVGICREDNPADVDEAYGQGTYARLFPEVHTGTLVDDLEAIVRKVEGKRP